MKNKITIIIVMLSILCLATVLVACDGKGDTTPSGNTGSGDNGTIIIDEDNQLPKFDGDDDIDYSKAVIIEGTTLTGLTEYGKTLSRIVIPDGVTSIGKGAFGKNVFYETANLISVEIPNSVTSIGAYAFSACFNLSYVNLPESLTYIGDYAFLYCTSLTSIDISDSIEFGKKPFLACTSIIIKCNGKEIDALNEDGRYVFAADSGILSVPIVFNCKNNEIADDGYLYVVADNGVQYALKDGIAKVSGHSYIFGKVTIARNVSYKGKLYNVNNVDNYSFFCAENLSGIVIPNSVTIICSGAFFGCISLTDIDIPNSVNYIGNGVFFDCLSLSYNEYDNGLYIGNQDNPYMILFKSKNTDITSCEINKNVKFIHSASFSNCRQLTKIFIPSGVIRIGSEAFMDCSNLTIYCEAESQPSEWDREWNCSDVPVIWGYKK